MRISEKRLKDIISEELNSFLAERDKKKRCVGSSGKGSINPYHDAAGRFSSKKDAASYSVRTGTGDCLKGQSKENPHRFTKVKCGRDEPLSSASKAKYRCKDGTEVSEGDLVSPSLLTDAQIDELASIDPQKVRKFCNSRGKYSMRDLLLYINNLAKAEKGELFKREKAK